MDKKDPLSHGSGMGLYDRDYMRKYDEDEGSPKSGSKRGLVVAGALILLVAIVVTLMSK